MEVLTRYFDSPGEENTEQVIDLAVERAIERRITHIVVASGTGKTGVMIAEKAAPKGIAVVVVTYHHGFSQRGKWDMEEKYHKRLQEMEVPVISASHAFSGVERSITRKSGAPSRIEVIAEVIRSLFGHGMKVSIEISIMAADAGAIPCNNDTEVISIGGTGEGVDTAVILTPSHSNEFFNLIVREIIAIPRSR